MSIRVLHLIGGSEIGGAEQNVLNLLINFDREKVTTILGCLVKESPFALLAQSQGIETSIFPMKFPLDPSPLLALVLFCRKNNITIIHSHGARANFLGRLVSRLIGIPCVSTVHSLPEHDYLSSWKGKAALYMDTFTLNLSSGLITVSDSLKNALDLRLKNKRFSFPIQTIYNGSPIRDFINREQMRKDFRKHWGIPDHRLVIGTIGRLHPVKGHVILIEAMKNLSKEIPNLHLLLVGQGPLSAHLHTLLLSSGFSYTMTDYLPSAWQSLPAMDLFVLPSLSEGMGIVLLEAAQAEIPIVASQIGGIPELFTDGSEALLIRPSDPGALALACRRILHDPIFAEHLTENARQKASHYSVDMMVNETTTFYKAIFNNV